MKKFFLGFLLLVLSSGACLGMQNLLEHSTSSSVPAAIEATKTPILPSELGEIPQEKSSAAPSPSTQAKSIPERVVDWYANNLNYGTIALLMLIESSFIPFPSEVVIPPAAYAACDHAHSSLYVTNNEFLNISFVVIAGTVGAILGALLNYFLAFFLGRPIINWFADSRWGNLCLIDSKKVEQAEQFFVRYGIASTFFGRLVPAVRQLISIPAGLSKMPLFPFILFTSLGAIIWNAILALIGYYARGQQELINAYAHELSWGILGLAFCFLLFLAYRFFKAKKK